MMQSRGHYLFVTWDGGGNLPPELGLAQELARRGHRVTFLGHAQQRSRIEAAGFAFDGFERSPAWDPLAPLPHAPRLPNDVFNQPAMAQDVQAEITRCRPDALVVDCMLNVTLAAAEISRLPAAVLVHTFCAYFLQVPEPLRAQRLAARNSLRAQLGLAPVASNHAAWRNVGRVLVASLPVFDPGAAEAPQGFRFIGPVFERTAMSEGSQISLQTDPSVPLVLVSLTALYHPAKAALLQRVLDGLADLPLRVIVTAADVPASDLRLPANAELHGFVPHSAVLPKADLVVSHGGHGTAMAALAHGLPLLLLPMFGDQPMVAANVAAAGGGRTLALDAEPLQIRAAVQDLLTTPTYRQAAQRLAQTINKQDGAALGADELEALLTSVHRSDQPSAFSSTVKILREPRPKADG